MKASSLIVLASIAFSFPSCSPCQQAAAIKPAPVAASAATAVPTLVPFSGTAESSKDRPLTSEASMTFLLFKDERGGEPLWVETQTVAVDMTGHYQVQLGASSPSGLPLTTFASGEGRWLEVQIAGQKPQPRVLLMSVPYAMKAADAATLGGLPASAFALAGTSSGIASGSTQTSDASGISPDATSTVTTTGGVSKYVPVFSGASTVIDSEIYDTGTSVGIGDIPSASAKLDVNGSMIVRGNTIVSRSGNATATKGFNSYEFAFYANAYNSSTKADDNPHFQMQSEPVGNNTANTSATFNLLYANGGTPTETGFYINPNGTLHFAPSQTFPGTGPGDITGVTAGAGLTGGGTSGAVTLRVDTTVIPTLTDSPTFSGIVTANGNGGALVGNATDTGFGSGAGVVGTATNLGTGVRGSGATGVEGDSPTGTGVVGTSTTGLAAEFRSAPPERYSVYVENTATTDSSSFLPKGLYATATGLLGISVEGFAPQGTGILGVSGSISSTGNSYGDAAGGTWGDTSGETPSGLQQLGGIVGTADNNTAAYFANNSDGATIISINKGSGGAGLFRTMQAITPDGTCGFGDKGTLTCTGQVKTLTATDGAHMVETYSVQSSESWMEDFGSGTVTNGVARISIDPSFASTVNMTADYHVFLTPRDDSEGLYVTNVTASGFEVHESKHGTSSLGFDYRIVAKRKGYEAQRLVDVTERFQAEMAIPNARIKAAAEARNHPRPMQLPAPPVRPGVRLQPMTGSTAVKVQPRNK